MKRIIVTAFIIVMLGAVITYAANPDFIGKVYDWAIKLIESQFGITSGIILPIF